MARPEESTTPELIAATRDLRQVLHLFHEQMNRLIAGQRLTDAELARTLETFVRAIGTNSVRLDLLHEQDNQQNGLLAAAIGNQQAIALRIERIEASMQQQSADLARLIDTLTPAAGDGYSPITLRMLELAA